MLYLLEQSNERGTPRTELEEIATRLAAGARPGQIVETLVHNGWPRDDANVVVSEVRRVFAREMVRKAQRRTVIGAVTIVASCGLAVVTFLYG